MTAKFRLFISHSSPEAPAKERLLAIIEAIREQAADEIHVLVDKEQIESGADWRRRISHMLTLCDGAVILLDSTACRSRWVLAEAMVLSTREAVEKDFRLFPVNLASAKVLAEARRTADTGDGTERAEPWEPVNLSRLQAILAEEDTAQVVAQKIVTALRKKGDLRQRRSSLERYADELADVLEKAPQNRLRDLADELDDEATPTVFAADELSRRSALAIARHFINSTNLGGAADYLGQLGTVFVRERGRTMIDLLYPVAFDAYAAANLIRPRPGGGYETVVIEANMIKYSVTGQLRLALLPRALTTPLYFLLGRYGTADSMRRDLLEQHREHERENSPPGDRPQSMSEEDLVTSLRSLQFCVCAPVVDSSVLAAVARDFPTASFLVVHSTDEPAPSLPGIGHVLPALGSNREQSIYTAHRNALLALNPLVST